MILETVSVGAMQVNCYILASGHSSQAIIIDPGDEEHKIKKALSQHRLRPAFIVNTHGHIDHIGCDDKFAVAVYIHRQDKVLLDNPALNLSVFFASPFRVTSPVNILEDRNSLKLEDIELEVIHLPGHTPGGIALLLKKPRQDILFTGDSLFCQSIGRTDFPGADGQLLLKSIKERLLDLGDNIMIYPGHGTTSTLGEEKKNNPFLA